MQVTNFNLTPQESNAIGEQQFFMLKHSATKKLVELFGEMEQDMKQACSQFDIEVENLNKTTGKIFRGENYRLFPYIVLDYPKLFSTETVFAFRSMFWWGHEFSFTLHLQGTALDKYRKNLLSNIDSLKGHDVFFCVNDTPWQYNFSEENYLPFTGNMDKIKDEVKTKSFVKLSRKMPVEMHDKARGYALDTFKLFLKLLG